MNKSNAIAFCLMMLSMGSYSFAQCPTGFVDVGEISATTAPGRYQEVITTKELVVPDGIQIDDAYHQKSIQAASDGGASDLRAIQIPAGFHLIPGGLTGSGWWSIDKPRLIKDEGTGNAPAHLIFRIDLYANTGGRSPATSAQIGAHPSPNVSVRVCVKTRT
jgi:hypothetical protein